MAPAIDQLLADARAVVASVTANSDAPSWDNVEGPLTDATERLGIAWNAVYHLNSVLNMDGMRDAFNAALPKVSLFGTELGQNLALFAKYQALRGNSHFDAWPQARKTIIDNALRDFRLAGAELPDADKARYVEVSTRMSELSAKFGENVQDATDAWVKFIADEGDLAGVPDDAKAMFAAMAAADGKEGYKLTLQFPCYFPVMQYADKRE
ncbi:MAG: hypothetical protein ACRCUI_10280, partial [Polymorphobacter sp.]